MSKDDKTKDPPLKTEIDEELDELAKEDDGSNGSDEDESEEEETSEEESEEETDDDKGDARKRDPKTGRFKPEKKDKGTKDSEEESDDETEEESDEDETEEESDGDTEEEEPEEETGPKSRSAKKIQQLVTSRNKANERIAHLEGQIKALSKGSKEDDEPAKVKTAAEVAAEVKPKIAELREKLEEARADNNTKEAAKLEGQIDDLKEQIDDAKRAESEVRSKAAARQELENERFDTARDYLMKVRPVLDKDSEEFDERVYREVAFQVAAYEKMGLTPYASLRRACRMIFVEDPFEKPTAGEDTDAKREKKGKDDKTKKTDVKKNIEADKKQPPRGGKHVQEENNGDINIDDLTDEELLALPPAKLARLDGSLG